IGTLVLAAMLLVLDKMLKLFQYVVDAGGPVSVVWRMLANLLPEYLSLGIPIGLMLGILLAFRKLALSSELDALRGIGIGYTRLLRVPYGFAIPLAIINLFIVGYLEPYTHYRYKGLQFDLKSGALGAVINQFRSRGGSEGVDELYLHELWRTGYGGEAATRAQQVASEAHFNFRMVEVVMMLMLPLLAIALAVPPKRSTSALGIFVSILI